MEARQRVRNQFFQRERERERERECGRERETAAAEDAERERALVSHTNTTRRQNRTGAWQVCIDLEKEIATSERRHEDWDSAYQMSRLNQRNSDDAARIVFKSPKA